MLTHETRISARHRLVRIDENHFPLHEPRRGAVHRFARAILVRARPRAPILLRARRIPGPHVERHIALRRAFSSPPGQPSPVRKNLGVECVRFEAAVLVVSRPQREYFPGIRRAPRKFSRRAPATRLVTCADAVLATLE